MEFPKLSILLFSGTVILRGAYSIGYAGSSTYGAASSGVMRSGFFVFMSARNQMEFAMAEGLWPDDSLYRIKLRYPYIPLKA